jgi:hypothetical protein
MPLKHIYSLIKAKKTKQTLLFNVYPFINNIIPIILMHFNLMLYYIVLNLLKLIKLKRYT